MQCKASRSRAHLPTGSGIGARDSRIGDRGSGDDSSAPSEIPLELRLPRRALSIAARAPGPHAQVRCEQDRDHDQHDEQDLGEEHGTSLRGPLSPPPSSCDCAADRGAHPAPPRPGARPAVAPSTTGLYPGRMTTRDLPEQIGDLPRIGRPANSALLAIGVTTLREISEMRRKDLLALHGVGPKAVRILEEALAEAGLSFAE